jgi:hypothetical protein
MPTWIDYAGFAIGLFVVLHLIAFIRPHGWVSRRLHPSFPADPDPVEREMQTLLRLTSMLENRVKLERDRQQHPHPIGDVELLTTVRRRPRQTQANSSIDGLRGPAL